MYFTLVLWKAEDSSKLLIKELEKFPSMTSRFMTYFSWTQAKSVGRPVYVDSYIQYSILIVGLTVIHIE